MDPQAKMRHPPNQSPAVPEKPSARAQNMLTAEELKSLRRETDEMIDYGLAKYQRMVELRNRRQR